MSKIIDKNTGKRLRSPIGVILGHVDSGKTSLLDKVRGTAVQAREAAGITQHVGASFFPSETIIDVCGTLMESANIKLDIPGVLIVDTPGHAAFMNLRKRGASVADIAILVVDVTRGFQAQTYESLDILRARKTPFIIAANKIDRISSWKSVPNATFRQTYDKQNSKAKADMDGRIYEIMGELSELNMEGDRYDRVKDFKKAVAIVPTSAKSGEGIPDLFLVLSGLTQQFMMKKLEYSEGPGVGTVLEVKEEEGLGTTIDVILYEGMIKKNDQIVVGGREEPALLKIRALLEPKELDEMRDPKDKFKGVDVIYASAGIKIAAPGLEDALAGAPIRVAPKGMEDEIFDMVADELEGFRIETKTDGIILKVDTLGSLEAIVDMIKEKNIPIQKADIGDVNKKDVIDAAIVGEKTPEYSAILCFNVNVLDGAQEEVEVNDIKIFSSNVIYNLIDDYERWMIDVKESIKTDSLKDLMMPGKILLLPNHTFRASKPAIVGIEVLGGRIAPKLMLIREDNKRVGRIRQLQDQQESVREVRKGKQVAMSIRGPTVGRQIREGDILYVDVPEKHAVLLMKRYRDMITADDIEILEELTKIKREHVSKFWG
jgi:translation initiation factor 5B